MQTSPGCDFHSDYAVRLKFKGVVDMLDVAGIMEKSVCDSRF